MDIAALQDDLRRFAAERGWETFHTPKNLAMALVVETAELAELFQWLTPEESSAAGRDAVQCERIGAEVADVLLYLVQLADHAGVDVDAVVDRKLRQNARKHPPTRPGLPAGSRPAVEREVHVLVDWENVQPTEAQVRALVPNATDLWLFHGPNQKGVGMQHGSFGERAVAVPISRTGKNALDFHLSFYMGYIAARHPDARFVALSNDQGYGPMLDHASALGFDVRLIGVERASRRVGSTPAAKKAVRPTAKKAPALATKKDVTTPAKKAAAPVPRKTAAPAAKKSAPPAAKKTAALAAKKAATPVVKKAASAARRSAASPPPAKGSRSARGKSAATEVVATKTASAKPAPLVTDPAAVAARVAGHLRAMPAEKRPSRRARLLGFIGSRLGAATDEAARLAVLEQLVRERVVTVDEQGGLSYV